MPNAKRFLITSETKEVIVIRPAAAEPSEGKCPLCGAEMTKLPPAVETNIAALPPAPDEADEPIEKHDEEEKRK